MKKTFRCKIIIALLFYLTGCVSGRMDIKKITDIKKQDHGFLVFTLPTSKEVDTGTLLFVIGENWLISLKVNNEPCFQDYFKPGETYKIPIPVGKHNIKYTIFAAKDKAFYGRIFYVSNDYSIWATSPKSFAKEIELNLEIKKDAIISIAGKKIEDCKIEWGSSCLVCYTCVTFPFGAWPYRKQKMIFYVETEEVPGIKVVKEIDKKRVHLVWKPVIMGKVFAVQSNMNLILSVKAGALYKLSPGSIIHIFKGKRIIAKAVVSQILHTQIKAKIIYRTGQIGKNLLYGIMQLKKE